MEFKDEEKLEMALKLSATAGVSIEDARNALNACNYDMLDAMVYLEKLGKTTAPRYESYTTQFNEEPKAQYHKTEKHKRVTITSLIGRFFKFCAKVIRIGCENVLSIESKGAKVLDIPIILVVLCILFAFWVTVPLLLIGLFCGLKYGFTGPLFKDGDMFNSAMDKASDVAESIKKDAFGEEE